jgi:hypothetical protein
MIVIVINNRYFYFKLKQQKKMKNARKNWKTTLLGLVTIIIGLITGKGHLDAQTGGAIVAGVGLILAKDSDQTGTAKEGEENAK